MSIYYFRHTEVVGLFMLDIISKKYLKENIGLYRVDGLSVFKNQTGHQNDKVKKFVRISYHLMNIRERHETQCHVESEVFIVPLIVMVI